MFYGLRACHSVRGHSGRGHIKYFINAVTVFLMFLTNRQVKNMAKSGFPLRVSRNALSTVTFPQSIASVYILYKVDASICDFLSVGYMLSAGRQKGMEIPVVCGRADTFIGWYPVKYLPT